LEARLVLTWGLAKKSSIPGGDAGGVVASPAGRERRTVNGRAGAPRNGRQASLKEKREFWSHVMAYVLVNGLLVVI
jgi:hypothetical protein